MIPSNEYRYVEYFETSKKPLILIRNRYIRKLSTIAKTMRIQEDFNGNSSAQQIKSIYCKDGICGILFKYNDFEYRFILPRRYPFEGPDDFDTNKNMVDKVYSKIPKSLYKRYLKYYKIDTDNDIPKINNWTEETSLIQVVDQYLSLKSDIIKVEQIRLLKKFIERITKDKTLELPEEIELLIYEYI